MSLSLRTLICLVAATVPAIVIGPAAVAVGLVGSLLLYPAMAERRPCFSRFRTSASSVVGLLVLVTFAAWLPNIVVSVDPERSFEAVFRTFLFVGVATILWSAVREDPDDRVLRLTAAITAVATVFALASLLLAPQLMSLLRHGTWEIVDAALWLKQPASSAMLLVPLLLLTGVRNAGAWRWLCSATAVGLVVIVWLTSSRSAVAGLLGIVLVWSFLTSLRHRRLAWTALVTVLSLAAVAIVFTWLYDTRSNISTLGVHLFAPRWLIDPHRQEIWQFAWHLGDHHRWFGLGANTIDRVADEGGIPHIPGTTIDRLPSHPHNWVIEIAVETGLIGLFAMLATAAAAVWQLLRDFLRDGDDAVLAGLLVWTGYWCAGMFNFSFWSSWWQCSFLLMVGICLAARRDTTRQPSAAAKP